MFKFDLCSGVITDLEVYNITEINSSNKNISTSNYDKAKFKINDKKFILKYNENPLKIGDKIKAIGLKRGKGKNSYLDIFAFNNFTALDNNITRISILHILFTSLLFIVFFISGFFFIALLFESIMGAMIIGVLFFFPSAFFFIYFFLASKMLFKNKKWLLEDDFKEK